MGIVSLPLINQENGWNGNYPALVVLVVPGSGLNGVVPRRISSEM
jgi:hypothetical protein